MLIALNLTHIGIQTPEYSNSKYFSEKLWLHRVNCLQRVEIIENKYRGLEIDVYFDSDKNCFDIFHSPGASTDLCLEELLASLNNPKIHYYWLDFKNLDSTNQKKSFKICRD